MRTALEAAETSAPTRSTIEKQVAEICRQLFPSAQIGAHDNLLDLGLDSLRAVQLAARISEAFRVGVSPLDIFESPSAGVLGKHVESLVERGAAEAPAAGEFADAPENAGGRRPLSFAQQRLWFLSQLEPASAAYNVPVRLRLKGKLDPSALRRSLNEIVRRHEVLRTSFPATDGEAEQKIAAQMDVAVEEIDLSGLDPARRTEQEEKLTREKTSAPFDLSQGPLLRVALLRLAEDEHLLLAVMHHIVSDDWSIRTMVRELGPLYTAFSKGEQPRLPELKIQYADFAARQRRWMTGEAPARQIAYWKKQLASVTPLELPLDRPRAAQATNAAALHRFHLPAELVRELRALGRKEEATLFMVLLAAFQVLLSRYCNQTDIAVGAPAAGRTSTDTEDLIGFFVNTVVLRTDIAASPTLRRLLRNVRKAALEACANQDVPFEKLVEELRPKRVRDRSPLFQAMLALHNGTGMRLELPGLAISPEPVAPAAAKFDLTLAIEEPHAGEGLNGAWEYRAELFDEATIARMAGHFETLLRGMAENSDQATASLALMTSEERRQLLARCNGTPEAFPHQPVHEIFEAQVRRTPQATAVEAGKRQLTFEELENRAGQLAHYLKKNGAGPESCVGICALPSPETLAGLLGILKAGAAYVAFDPHCPPSRLSMMAQDCGIELLICDEQSEKAFTGLAKSLVRLDAGWQNFAGESVKGPNAGTRPENLAYVSYVPGPAGQPEGVAMPHNPIGNLIQWQMKRGTAGHPWRTLVFPSMGFDVSAQEIFATWCAGGCIVLAGEEARRDPAALWRMLREQKIERAFLPAFMLQQLAESSADKGPENLKEIIVSGEQFRTTPAAQKLFQKLPGCTLEIQYGARESLAATAHRLEGDPVQWPAVPSIGPPIANTQVYVLDQYLEPAPIGATGEVFIGGAGSARGYLNQPGLTAERFIPDGFTQTPGGRLYRTGDLAKWNPSGELEFLGRRDLQVKFHGHRIELGEIEAALRGHAGVEQAAVALQEGPGGKRLVAYVVRSGHAEATDSILSLYLKKRLPEPMTPAAWVYLDNLPVTPDGKVNRAALTPPAGWPRNETEKKLAGIWANILGLPEVGVHDDFFRLGGHSLMATQMINYIRDTFRVDVPIHRLFEAPTIAQLAQVLEPLIQSVAAGATAAATETPQIQRVARRTVAAPKR